MPTALYFKYQRQRLWHETARIALEKGQPLPVNSAKDEQESHSPRARNDLRTGMILIAVSVGLMLTPWRFNGLEQVNGLWFGAAIPGCIGVALLLNALLTAVVSHFTKKNRSDNSAPDAPFKKS